MVRGSTHMAAAHTKEKFMDKKTNKPTSPASADRTIRRAARIASINAVLEAGNLQASSTRSAPVFGIQPFASRVNSAEQELSVLRKIRLEWDEEPDLLGDAEIFGIISGLRPDMTPFVKVQDMPWLNWEETDYTPNMDIVNWAECGAPYVNLQLFEDDDDTNFVELGKAILKGVTTGLASNPVTAPYALVSEIGGMILGSMDSKWFRNDTDYVDSFYVIERGKTYTNYGGAAGNATVTIEPYTVR
jgi:hypothetical protein